MDQQELLETLSEISESLKKEVLINKINTRSLKIMQVQHKAMNESLAEHMRRTNLLEKKMENQDNQIRKALAPIEFLKTLSKVVAVLSTLAGIIAVGYQVFKK